MIRIVDDINVYTRTESPGVFSLFRHIEAALNTHNKNVILMGSRHWGPPDRAMVREYRCTRFQMLPSDTNVHYTCYSPEEICGFTRISYKQRHLDTQPNLTPFSVRGLPLTFSQNTNT